MLACMKQGNRCCSVSSLFAAMMVGAAAAAPVGVAFLRLLRFALIPHFRYYVYYYWHARLALTPRHLAYTN